MDNETKVAIEPPPVVIVPPKTLLFEPDDTYDVTFCCARGNRTSCDKALLEWFAKTLVSGSVLTFCFWQLANKNGSSEYYTSSISLIIGTYLGTHQASQKKPKQP